MAITRLGGANAITGTLPAANINDTSISNITALPAAISTGKVLQVVTAKSTTETFTSSGTYSDIASVSITPASTSNKILVIGSVNSFRREGGSSGILTARVSDKSSFNQKLVHAAMYDGSSGAMRQGGVTGSFLHSPSTTSAKTYYIQFASNNSGQSVGIGDNNESNSTITVMEIEA
jgi:hypothetical protein